MTQSDGKVVDCFYDLPAAGSALPEVVRIRAGVGGRHGGSYLTCTRACYSLWRRGVTFHVLDVSHETPDVTPDAVFSYMSGVKRLM